MFTDVDIPGDGRNDAGWGDRGPMAAEPDFLTSGHVHLEDADIPARTAFLPEACDIGAVAATLRSMAS